MNEHFEFDALDEFALGTLDERDAARVAAHLPTCAACRAEYNDIRNVFDALPQALPAQRAPAVLRDRIFAAIDPPGVAKSSATLVRALAAALVLALLGDALLALRLAQPTRIARVPAPARSAAGPSPASKVRTALPAQRSSAAPGPPTARPATAAPSTPSPTAAPTANPLVAQLKHELALAQSSSAAQHARIEQLRRALALTPSSPQVVTVIVTPAPAPTASASAAAVPDDDRLVGALRTGKVFTIDGAIGNEPWHLTIVQPADGAHALVYSGTPDAPSGDTYHAWVVRGGRTVSIGDLPPGKPATLEMPMALEPGDVIAFSREPLGPADAPTSPFLMQYKVPQ